MTVAGVRRMVWRTVFRCTGGIEVRGALPPGGCVVVANHCSHADAPAILAALDAAHRPVVAAAADYWFTRAVKARICRWLVAGFPVRRAGGGYGDLAAHRAELEGGRAVVVFPAGSRHSVDGRFRTGAFRLAREAGVPVVGVRLHGTARLLSPGGRIRRGKLLVEILPAVPVDDPQSTAASVQAVLAAPCSVVAGSRPGIRPGSRARLARLAASPAGAALAFCWAMAEGLSWPVLSELLIAVLVLSGPARLWSTGMRLSLAAALGSAVGGTVTLMFARHGVLLPQPLTNAPMKEYVQRELAARGTAGLWSQPMSGVPYKVYAQVAGRQGIAAPGWFFASAVIRSLRMMAVALLAGVVQRLTRRWQSLYTPAVAAGCLMFVVGLCLVVTRWSQTGQAGLR